MSVCRGCLAPRVKGTLIHKAGCLGGAALVGGEFDSASAHGDARAWTEESQEHDYQTMKARGDVR